MDSKQYFENIAENWDSLRETLFPVSLRDKAIKTAEISYHSIVADIGAGSGFITEGLLDKVEKIIAVDQSEKMLSYMRKKFSGCNNIDYRIGESEKLPIADEETDYVFANMYLHHVENPQKSINELYRILKPGGKLIISDADTHNYEFLVTEQHDIWMGFDRTDIKKWYNNAGFKNVNIVCSGDNCRPKSESGKDAVEISIFIAIGQK
jgi:ubiquinone/menaquinone biosynthesis C-methylase UbiE